MSHHSSETVDAILTTLDDKPASYLAAARRLAQSDRSTLRKQRVFVLSSFTVELVAPYVVVECARIGVDVEMAFGPFGQLEQQALEPDSQLAQFEPDLVIIATRIEDLATDLDDGFLSRLTSVDTTIDAYVERISTLCRHVRDRIRTRVIVWNQPPLQRLVAGVGDASLDRSQQGAMHQLNDRLARAVAADAGVTVFDVARVATEVGTRAWFDARLELMARCPLSATAQHAVAKLTARLINAMARPPRKCLVLDLDNTLWGGVLGEDGVAGIKLGADYPGNAFVRFQRAVRSLRDRGILLAIASKNNETDVDELFASHRDMVLRREDFAARQVHWNDKAQSLQAIATELNIGIDALVFFDDNPVEREWIQRQLPEVLVVDVPSNVSHYIRALDQSGAFDQVVITAEDLVRAEQYQIEHDRHALQCSAGSVEEFLRALQMKATVGTIAAPTLSRVVQLLGKTNQFNLTTRRHSESDLARMLEGDAIGLWIRVADRFGDHGLVGVALAVREESNYRLDSFLLSCRVLGRRVEHALLGVVLQRAQRAGAASVLAEFIPTKKNTPAATFLADAGFTRTDAAERSWCMDLQDPPALPDVIEIVEES